MSCAWLVFQDALTAGDRLVKWDYKGEICCVFCRNGVESKEHLFFKCSYSGRIWQEGMRRCTVDYPPVYWDWDEVVQDAWFERVEQEVSVCQYM